MTSVVHLDFILIALAIVAGLYVTWNIGANDVANAMGTSVGARALTLKQAVILAAILEFSGAYFFGSHVSSTIQKGLLDLEGVTDPIPFLVSGMLSTLIATGLWLQIASYNGIPVSTTHAIVGSVVGFGIVFSGYDAVNWATVSQIVATWIFSPVMGGMISFLLFTFIKRKIFFSKDPIRATRKYIPVLIFLVSVVLGLLVQSKIFPHLSFLTLLLQSIVFAFITSTIGKLIINKLKLQAPLSKQTDIDPNVIYSVEKVQKHLLRLKKYTKDDLRYQFSSLLGQVDHIADTVKSETETHTIHVELQIVERIFKYLQISTASMMAFAHGANDVANAIGPLAVLLHFAQGGIGLETMVIPGWLLALGGFGIVVGLATWGWRIIETIGHRITALTCSRGFSAEFGASLTILAASRMGIPISTTHTLVGSILGVGLARGMGALNLTTIRDIFLSWIITIPMSALLAILFYQPIHALLF